MIKGPFVTSGIRVGVPAITTRGMKEDDMEIVVALTDRVLMNIDDEKIIAGVKEEVKDFMKQFSLYPELGKVGKLADIRIIKNRPT